MSTTTPVFAPGDRVIVAGAPQSLFPDVRAGGPGVIVRMSRSNPDFYHVMLTSEQASTRFYHLSDIRREPTV